MEVIQENRPALSSAQPQHAFLDPRAISIEKTFLTEDYDEEHPPSELIESIRLGGLRTPCLVVSRQGVDPRIVDGRKRVRVACEIGLDRIPVYVLDGSVLSSEYVQVEGLRSQLASRSLKTLEKARWVRLIQGYSSATQADVRTLLGLTPDQESDYLRLANLSRPVRRLISEQNLSLKESRVLARLSPQASSLFIELMGYLRASRGQIRLLGSLLLDAARTQRRLPEEILGGLLRQCSGRQLSFTRARDELSRMRSPRMAGYFDEVRRAIDPFTGRHVRLQLPADPDSDQCRLEIDFRDLEELRERLLELKL